MRKSSNRNGITMRGISGTHVVSLYLDATTAVRKDPRGFLGFALHREDHTENEKYWLRGFKTFREIVPNPVQGQTYSSWEHPFQTFTWGDYTAKPDHEYSYTAVPVFGKPKNLEHGNAVKIKIKTESEDDGVHAVFFNRGVAGSQAYIRRFGYKKPHEVADNAAYKWLSRGLEEAIIEFIGQAKNSAYGLYAAVYEFSHRAVAEAFAKAKKKTKGDVHIIYHARGTGYPGDKTVEVAGEVGIDDCLIPRQTHSSPISHNKFIILTYNNKPIQVWTGSTNFTDGGIYGHSNVGHLIRDKEIAEKYMAYWKLLEKDPENRYLRDDIMALTPDPVGPPANNSLTASFSPRKFPENDNMLIWYGDRIDDAQESISFTAAFGVNNILADVIARDKDYLRFLLLETKGSNYDVYTRDKKDTNVSIGSHLTKSFDARWIKETLTGLNTHVRYIHTKYLLVDPLSKSPIVVSGSANFSKNSIYSNDENMVITRGNTRLADIYLGEFMRIYNHFYFRYHSNRMIEAGVADPDAGFLKPDSSWTDKYYVAGSFKEQQRKLFAGML